MLTTVSTDNVDFALSLGADVVIDYKTQRFEKWQQAIDFVAIVNSPVTIGRKNV